MPSPRGQVASPDAGASPGPAARSASLKGNEDDRQSKQQMLWGDQSGSLLPELPSFFPSFVDVDASSKVLKAYARRCIDDEQLLFFRLPRDQWRGFAARHRLEVAGVRQRQGYMNAQNQRSSPVPRDAVGSGRSGNNAVGGVATASQESRAAPSPVAEVVDAASGTLYSFSTFTDIVASDDQVHEMNTLHGPDYDGQHQAVTEDHVVNSRTTLLYVLYVEGSCTMESSVRGVSEHAPASPNKSDSVNQAVLRPTRSLQISTLDGHQPLKDRPADGAALETESTAPHTSPSRVGPATRLVHFSLTPGWSPLGSLANPPAVSRDGDCSYPSSVAAVMDVVFSDVPQAATPVWRSSSKTSKYPSDRLANAWKEVRQLMNLSEEVANAGGSKHPADSSDAELRGTDGLSSGADGGVVPLRRVTLPSSMCPVWVPRQMEDGSEPERAGTGERPGVPPAQLVKHARWCESARAVIDECHEEPLSALLFVIPAIQRTSVVVNNADDTILAQSNTAAPEEGVKGDDPVPPKSIAAKPPLAPVTSGDKPPAAAGKLPISPHDVSPPSSLRRATNSSSTAQNDVLNQSTFASDSQTNQGRFFSAAFDEYTGPDNSFVVFSGPFLEQVYRRVEFSRAIIAESHSRQRREEEVRTAAAALETDKDSVNRFSSSGSLRKQRASVNATPARRKSKSTSISQRLSLQTTGNREGASPPSERRRSKTALLLNSAQLTSTQQQSVQGIGLGGATRGIGPNSAGASRRSSAAQKSGGVRVNACRLESWDEQKGAWRPVRRADEQFILYSTVIDRCALLPAPLQLILKLAQRQQPHLTKARLIQQHVAVATKLSTMPTAPPQPSPIAPASSPKGKGKQAANTKSSRAASEINPPTGNVDSKASHGDGNASQRIWSSALGSTMFENSLFGGFPPFMVECSNHYSLLTSAVAAHESEVESFCASLVHELVEKTVSEYVSSQWDNVAPTYAASSVWDEMMTFVDGQISLLDVGKKVMTPMQANPNASSAASNNKDLLSRLWFDPNSWAAMLTVNAAPIHMESCSRRSPNRTVAMTSPRAVEVESSARSVISVVQTRSSPAAPVHRGVTPSENGDKKNDVSSLSSSSKHDPKESKLMKVHSVKAIVPHTTVLPTPKKNSSNSKRAGASKTVNSTNGPSPANVPPPRLGGRQKETRQTAS